jgi:hypothetical protein
MPSGKYVRTEEWRRNKSLQERGRRHNMPPDWRANVKNNWRGGQTGDSYARVLCVVGFIREFSVQWGKGQERYHLDFAEPTLKINIELDGPQHLATFESDAKRDEWLRSQGWLVLRIGHM